MAEHYFSKSTGSEAGAGTEADPLGPLDPITSTPSDYAEGDTISLRVGDTWREGVVVPQSGDTSGDFTVNSYGTSSSGTGGGGLIQDWSFENWSSPTALVEWEQTNLGGGAYASFIKQALTPYHKALAVTMRCEDPYPPGGVISVSQVVGDLENNETYNISLYHKEHLNDNTAVGYNQWSVDFQLKIMVERRYFSTAGVWVIEYWKNDSWSEGMDGEVLPHSLSWKEYTTSFGTGDNPNGAGTYRLHIFPDDNGIALLGTSTDGSFNVDLVSLSKDEDVNPVLTGADPVGGWAHGTSGVNLLTDPDFEDWANNTDLTSWEETEAGSSTIDREQTEVYIGSNSVNIRIEAGDAAAVWQDGLVLEDQTEYTFSVYHKEDLSPDGAYNGIDLLVARYDSAASVQYVHGYDNWITTTQGDHWQDNSTDWVNSSVVFNTGPNSSGYTTYKVFVATSYDFVNSLGCDFYVDAAVLSKTETQNLLIDSSFESWVDAEDLTSWDENIWASAYTDSSIDRIPDNHSGRYSVRLNSQRQEAFPSVAPAVSVSQELNETLTDDTRYRISCYHKEPNHDLYARMFISRVDTSGTQLTTEYWDTETETWLFGSQPKYYNALEPNSKTWAYGYIDFDTGANANGYYFYTAHFLCSENLPQGTFDPHHYYFDDVRLVKIGNGELLTDPSFENWTGTELDSWTIFKENNAVAIKSDVRIFDGDWGVSMLLDDFAADPSDVGVYQTGIPLEASTTYRVGVWHHEESYRSNYPKCAIKLKRESDSYYWTGSAWSATEQDAVSEHAVDFALLSTDVTTDSTGSDTYTLTIHRDAATSWAGYRIFFDHATIHEKDKEQEVYQAYFASADGDPKLVYVDGEIWGKQVENLVLFDETDLLASDETDHPHLYCWSYDSTDDILYVNLGTDPGKLTVEASVREFGVEFNGESYVTLDDVTVQRFWGTGIDMGYTSGATARATDLTVSNCNSLSSGKVGISAGYHPPDPAVGGTIPSLVGYTPANITIEYCEIRRWAQNRDRHVTLANTSTYRVPNGGIKIFPSSDAAGYLGPLVEDVIIRRNLVDGEWYMHNRGGDRNGIDVHLGNDVYVYENEVKRSPDHGIVITGYFSVETAPNLVWQETDRGDVRGYYVAYNHVYDQADDCIWVWGIMTAFNAAGALKNKVCYNLCHDCTDNGLDISSCAAVEVYGNTFYNCKNEQIALRSWPPYSGDSGAFIFNNVFANWGTEWVDLPDQPGMRLGVAIGIQTRTEGTLPFTIDGNFYYQDPTADTADFPCMANVDGTVDLTQRTWAEWQALGFEENGQIGTDPEFLNPDEDDFTLYYYSPVFNSGLSLTSLEATITGTLQETFYFDNINAVGNLLEPTTVWPDAVVTMAQGSHHLDTGWACGAFGRYTYSGSFKKNDNGPPFPTDKTLTGVPVYLVDATDHKIWRGIITANTFDTLWVDTWEGMFNTSGLKPTGVLKFYLGYLYLYDKTPVYAFENVQWEKGLTEHELITNNIPTANPIYFKRSINHGDTTETEANSLSGDRMKRKILSGLHRNFQHEHALLTNQEIRIKSSIYHVVWKRGRMDQ